MRRWVYYSLADGAFTGRTVLADAEPSPPQGFGVLELGDDQQLRADVRRMNLATLEVEPFQPPPPADDEQRTWAWDPEAERWLPQPTVAALREVAAISLVRQIEAAEAGQARALREAVLALAAGKAAPAAALQALTTLDESIAPLRAQVQAVAVAEDAAELQAVAPGDAQWLAVRRQR